MFGPDAMRVPGAELHLTKLKVKQLQEELAVREATRSGRKRALQLRLRALIIAAAAEEEDEEYRGVVTRIQYSPTVLYTAVKSRNCRRRTPQVRKNLTGLATVDHI